MSDHTQGPWKISRNSGNGLTYIVEASTGKPIARTIETQGKANEFNTRMIAAAPDLLDAVIYAIDSREDTTSIQNKLKDAYFSATGVRR